jgi:hypothetical protein
MNIFEKKDQRERLEREIGEARKNISRQKRTERDLSKVQSGGRVSSFLKRESENNAVLSASLNMATAPSPLALGQAIIQYQGAINESKQDFFSRSPQEKPERPMVGGGGGGDSCVGLVLYVRTVGNAQQVWISAGTVAGQLPAGFNASDGKSIASGGDGFAWARVNISQQNGSIISVDASGGSLIPNNTTTSFYYLLGAYQYVNNSPNITNYGCGSVSVTVCRNWFTSQSPYYNVTFIR